MTLGVCSYTITGPAAATAGLVIPASSASSSSPPPPFTRGLLDGRDGGGGVGRLSGCGLGPCRLLTVTVTDPDLFIADGDEN
jgi:hypothetical protein